MSKHDERKFVRYPGGNEGMPMLRPDAPALFGGRGISDDLGAAERRWCAAFGMPLPSPGRPRAAAPVRGKRTVIPPGPALEAALGAVAESFLLPPDVLLGRARDFRTCRVRHALCALLGEAGWSTAQIGLAIDRRRFAVQRAQRMARSLSNRQPGYRADLDRARARMARALASAVAANADETQKVRT